MEPDEDPYEGEETMDRSLPDFCGPYDANQFGIDAFDHPVNAYGRCKYVNRIPRECPPKAE